jgi:hypothetical protein
MANSVGIWEIQHVFGQLTTSATLCSTWIVRSVDGYGANFAPSSLAWDDTKTV